MSREHREALEDRIYRLEAQLSAHLNAPMHGIEGVDKSILAPTPVDFNSQDTLPPINPNTVLSTSFDPSGLDMDGFVQSSTRMIAINQCEHVLNMVLPSSPVPSFWSGTTPASSPDMPPTSVAPQHASTPQHLLRSKPVSSPLEPHTAPFWESMMQYSQKNAGTTGSSSHSRHTSITSVSLASDGQVISPIPEVDNLLSFAAVPRLPRQGVFALSPTASSTQSNLTDPRHAVSTTPLPSRFEFETLTAEFMQHVECVSPQAYGVSPNLFAQLCEMVYPTHQKDLSSIPLASMSMARFHVFLAMATGMKLRIKDSPEHTNTLLDTCYDLAMQQTFISTFWQEDGGVEAGQLLALFAGIRKTSSLDPTPLQHSFTW